VHDAAADLERLKMGVTTQLVHDAAVDLEGVKMGVTTQLVNDAAVDLEGVVRGEVEDIKPVTYSLTGTSPGETVDSLNKIEQ
jgi:hypothetical protein